VPKKFDPEERGQYVQDIIRKNALTPGDLANNPLLEDDGSQRAWRITIPFKDMRVAMAFFQKHTPTKDAWYVWVPESCTWWVYWT